MPYICRENLEKEVDDATKKGCSIKLDSRPKGECQFIQKVAEDKLLRISVYNNVLKLHTLIILLIRINLI